MSPREDSFWQTSISSSMSIFPVSRISPTRYISPYFITNVKALKALLEGWWSEGGRCSVQIAQRADSKISQMLPKLWGSLEAYQFYPILLVSVVKVTDSNGKGWNHHWIFSQVSIHFKLFSAIIGKIVALVLSWPVSFSPSHRLSYKWDVLFECFQRNRWQLVCLDKVFCALIWRRPKRGVLSYLILPGYFK